MSSAVQQLQATLANQPNNAYAISSLSNLVTNLGQVAKNTSRSASAIDPVDDMFNMLEAWGRNRDGSLNDFGEKAAAAIDRTLSFTAESLARTRDLRARVETSYYGDAPYRSGAVGDFSRVDGIDRSQSSGDDYSKGDYGGSAEYAGYASGTSYVPKTDRYLLHQGEIVLNPREAQTHEKRGVDNRRPVITAPSTLNVYGITDPAEFARKADYFMQRNLNDLTERLRGMA
jgi:hypothetical protein